MDINNIRHKYLSFYSDCIPVKGALNAAIYDLSRQEIIKIPQVYFDLIQRAKTVKIGELLDQMQNIDSQQNVIDFINYLDDNEFINLTIKPAYLLDINFDWQSSCSIQNAIIDIDEKKHDFNVIIDQLDLLGCEIIQLRYFSNNIAIEEISEVLKKAYHTSIQGIEVVVCFNPNLKKHDYVKLMENESIIAKLTVHSASVDEHVVTTFGEGTAKASLDKSIVFIKEKIYSHSHCGLINMKNINKPTALMFVENKNFNGCLNKKISIDVDGLIKNCPSMSDSFGHHKDTDMISVLAIEEFTNKWLLKKDDISVCKDCEFRYACTDCRAYLSDPQDSLSKPLKCGYDPYKGVWSDWKNNVDNAIAIKYYQQLEKP